MKELLEFMSECMKQKLMVRFSAHPGGHISLVVFEGAKPFSIECASEADLPAAVQRVKSLLNIIPPTKLPPPPGM